MSSESRRERDVRRDWSEYRFTVPQALSSPENNVTTHRTTSASIVRISGKTSAWSGLVSPNRLKTCFSSEITFRSRARGISLPHCRFPLFRNLWFYTRNRILSRTSNWCFRTFDIVPFSRSVHPKRIVECEYAQIHALLLKDLVQVDL